VKKINIRENALKYGVSSLKDEELLALVLKSGFKDKNVSVLSNELIEKMGGFKNIFACTYDELISIKGLGKAKTLELLAIIEIAKRLSHPLKIKKEQLVNPEKIVSWIRFNIAFQNQETFFVIYMSKSGIVIKYEKLFTGTNEYANVSVDEVIRRALLAKASYLVIAHNHPGGSIEPSNADINITNTIKKALSLVNIYLLDHLIITLEDFYSFKRSGYL